MFNKIIIFIILTTWNYSVLSIHYGSSDGIKTKVAVRENLNRNYNAYQQNNNHQHYQQESEPIRMHHQYSQVRSYTAGSGADYQQGQATVPQITTSMLPPRDDRQLSYEEYMRQQSSGSASRQSSQSADIAARTRQEPYTSQNVNQNVYQQQTGNQYGQNENIREQREYQAQPSEEQGNYALECPPEGTGQFAYLMDCRQFLNCWKGRGSIQSCPPGTLFNPIARECDFPSKVTCKSMNNPNSIRTGSLIAKSPVECEPHASGLFPHPYECAKFLNCANGVTYIQDCGPGTVFNPLFSVCDFPYNVDCGAKSITPIESNYLEGESSNVYENYRANNQNGQENRPVYNQNQHQHEGSHHRTGYGRHDEPSIDVRGTGRIENQFNTQQSTSNRNEHDDQVASLNENVGPNRATNRYDDQFTGFDHRTSTSHQTRRNDDDLQVSQQVNRNELQEQSHQWQQNRPREPTTTTPVPRKWVYPWEARTSTTTPRPYYRVPEPTTTETPKPIYYRQNNLDRQASTVSQQRTTQHQSNFEQQFSGSKSKYNDENPPWIRRQQKQQTEYHEDPLDIQQQHTSWDLYQQNTDQAEKIISTTTSQPEPQHIQSINRKTATSRSNIQHQTTNQQQTNQDYYQSKKLETHNNIGTINSSLPLSEAMQLLLRPYLNRSGTVTEHEMNQFHQTLLPVTDVEKTNDNRTIYKSTNGEWNRNDIDDDDDEEISGEALTTPQPNDGVDVSRESHYKPTLKSNIDPTNEQNNTGSYPNRKIGIHQRHRKHLHGFHHHHHHHGHHHPDSRDHNLRQPTVDQVLNCEDNGSGERSSGEKKGHKHRHRHHIPHHHHRHHHRHGHHTNTHTNRCNTSISNTHEQPIIRPTYQIHSQHDYSLPNNTLFSTQPAVPPPYPQVPSSVYPQVPMSRRHWHWSHRHHYPQYHRHPHFMSPIPQPPTQTLLPPFSHNQSTLNIPAIQPAPNHHHHHYHHHHYPHFIPQPPPFPDQNFISTNTSSSNDFEIDQRIDHESSPPIDRPSITVQVTTPGSRHYVPPPNLPQTPVLPPQWTNHTQHTGIKTLDIIPPFESSIQTNVYPMPPTTPIIDNSLPSFTNSSIPSTGVLPLPLNPTTPEVDNTFQYHTNFNNCAESTSYACGNGECVNQDDVCDGKSDCGNRKDELNCDHIGYEVRLSSDSGNAHEGRVEVKVYGVWGYICDDKFGMRDADVLCQELGFELGASEVRANSFYSPNVNVSKNGNPIFMMDEIDCLGNETSLRECNFNGWGVHDCNPEEVVGVVCKIPIMACPLNYWLCDTSKECIPTSFLCDNVPDCADGSDERESHCQSSIEVRLVGGVANLEGRLEIKYRGIWGTVCDDDFTNREATVVCRALGHGGPAFAVKAGFGPGTGQIWLDQVNCIGNETSIEHCTHWAWGEHNCAHTEDVGIRCTPGPVLPFVEVPTTQSINSQNLNKVGRSQNLTGDFPEIVYQMQRSSRILPDQCGRVKVPGGNIFDQPNYSFRVIKGTQAPRGQHPWQASIRVRGQGKSAHWCGAVIISRYHLLTAAHCLIGFPKGAYLIRMGDHNSEVLESSEVEIFIENIYSHEDFRKEQHMNNDIALVVLKQPVRFNNYIQPVCLPPSNVLYEPGMNCTISGWGSIQSGKSTPSVDLRAGTVPILPMELCQQKHVYGTTITDGMFCAGFLDEGVDACDGDSGGPLVCMHNGVHTLYGIISWGQHCGYENRPGVYTKVSQYNDWIQQKLNQSMHAYGV